MNLLNANKPEVLTTAGDNQLFPVFLKLNTLRVLLVGAGNVGLEKLSSLVTNSPACQINIVADEVSAAVRAIALDNEHIGIQERPFAASDLDQADLVIVATNNHPLNEVIRQEARKRKLLVNFADKPALCDFYLGSVVKKGDLKVAISTNGKSPTMAKRIKEDLEKALPDDVDTAIQQLHQVRNNLNGTFAEKVKKLNEITEVMITGHKPAKRFNTNYKLLAWCTIFISATIIGVLLWHYEPGFQQTVQGIHPYFYYFLVAGFIFSMIDGAIGMSYGVTSTTFSLSMGIPPASASTAVHLSEIMSNAIAGWMHFKLGNVNKKLFKLLVISGSIGAVTGAYLLSSFEHYNMYIKPVVSTYTLVLGIVILSKAFKVNRRKVGDKIKKIIPLGLGGGFMDAVGGGGWGSIVLSSLIAGGRNSRTSLGTVKLSRFFIAFLSSITFITMVNGLHWEAIGGLIIGSAIASPIAVRVSNKISAKTIMVCVGIIVTLVSLRSLYVFLDKLL
jgi:siroheme synthase-like protein